MSALAFAGGIHFAWQGSAYCVRTRLRTVITAKMIAWFDHAVAARMSALAQMFVSHRCVLKKVVSNTSYGSRHLPFSAPVTRK
jgi:hypothetical protein